MRRDTDRVSTFTRRSILLGAGQAALFAALGARLYYLQVVEAQRYATLADDNRINMRLISPSRGLIFDRNGEALAVNRNNFRVLIAAERRTSTEAVLERLSEIVPLSDAEKRRVLREAQRNRGYAPVLVRENVSWEDVARLEFNAPDLPGVSIDVGQVRVYPQPELLSHIVGYVGAVDQKDLDENDDPLLQVPGLRIGKKGVEKWFDDDLRGKAGAVQVEVNAVGRVVRELERNDGEQGANLLLTIDFELQKFIAEKLKDESASVVVMDVVSGDIVAMVSTPGYDPNAFARGITNAEWQALLNDPMAPLNNKATQGVYPPGSTYKMVTAVAALDARAVDPSTRLFCGGSTELGDLKFHCWLTGGHGWLNLPEALAQSCDCYFYEAARRAGVDRIGEIAARFGFGKSTDCGLPGERPGVQPSRAWKQERFAKPWVQGDTFNLGIGQGFMLATPMQLAVMTARIANGGYEVKPNLVLARAAPRAPLAPPGAQEKPTAPPLRLPPGAIEALKLGMNWVVNHTMGTANASRLPSKDVQMAGKTGTAQVKRITEEDRRRNVTQDSLPWHHRHHALFVGYAPVDNPRYALSVIVEHGMGGSRTAAPLGRDIMAEVLKRDPSRNTARFRMTAAVSPDASRPAAMASADGRAPDAGGLERGRGR